MLALPALVMIMCAFLVKSAVFPFHFWQPDFHTTAPTPLSAMLSSIVVKVGIYGIIRNNTLFLIYEAELVRIILIVLGVIGIFFGGLAALRTWNAKRMLAYSTLGQVGFILVAIGWGSQLAQVAALIYIFNHAFIKSGMLMITGVIASHNEKHSANFKELRGAGKGMPAISVLYLIGGLALAGIPPLNGFISKVALVRGGADVESWVVLGHRHRRRAADAALRTRERGSTSSSNPNGTMHRRTAHGDGILAPALLISACILLGVFAAPLVNVVEDTVTQMSNPAIYTCAVLAPAIDAGRRASRQCLLVPHRGGRVCRADHHLTDRQFRSREIS